LDPLISWKQAGSLVLKLKSVKTQLLKLFAVAIEFFAVSGDFQIGLGCFLLLPKLEGSKVIRPQL